MLKFIKNHAALFIEEERVLVITDLHIGVVHELSKSGIKIPSQLSMMERETENLIKKTGAKELIILGDIKHTVPGIGFYEKREVLDFLERVSSLVRLRICKGNHDDRIEKIVPKDIELHGPRGFRIGKYGFFHGHSWPSTELLGCDYLILGHTHPTLQFVDKFGYRIVKPVWVRGEVDKKGVQERYGVEKVGMLRMIIVPAFNKLLAGAPINARTHDNRLFGPLLRTNVVNIKECELYLLDGTYLGKLSML